MTDFQWYLAEPEERKSVIARMVMDFWILGVPADIALHQVRRLTEEVE